MKRQCASLLFLGLTIIGFACGNQEPPPPPQTPLRVAIIYDQQKDQLYISDDLEFPIDQTSKSEDEFKTYAESVLKKNVVPKQPIASAPTKFSLTPIKKISVNNFGDILIYHWDSYSLTRGDVYQNAYAVMVFDDGGSMAQNKFPGMDSKNAKDSARALEYFLRDPAAVHELHKLGFKIPGESNLYQTLKELDPSIDVSKYPDLHI